jgi:hypothetical protein
MGIFWDICVYLTFELASALMVKLIFHKTAGQLVGPYLSIAAPGVSFLLLVRWLWRWKERGPSPKQLALGWGLSIALFFLALSAAFFYSSVELRFVNSSDAVWVFGMMGVGGTTAGFLAGYTMTLQRISAKAVNNADGK